MSTLYLFGNGFDLAHGIQTPYYAFRKHLAEHHEDFLCRFEAQYHIQPLDDSEPWYTEKTQEAWDNRVYKNLWKTFEEDMGKPDVDGMYDFAVSLNEGMPSDGVVDTLDEYWREEYGFSANLQKYVLEWLLSTVDTSKCVCRKKSLVNANSDFYINFNYTDTLERVYGITNVLHIHGGIPSCSDTPPIMGHGNKILIDQNRAQAKQYHEDSIEWAHSIYKAIANFAQSLYKDTDLIIKRNEPFFSSLSSIDQVITFGLSFGDVDIPYLERILHEINPQTKWFVYYHTPEDKERLKCVFGILGISRKYEVYFLHSDKFWDEL